MNILSILWPVININSRKEVNKEVSIANFTRLYFLALIGLVAHAIYIVVNYIHLVNSSEFYNSYITLLSINALCFLLYLAYILYYFNIKRRDQLPIKEIRFVQTLFILFILYYGVMVSLLNYPMSGYITTFIIVCFAMSVFVYMSNRLCYIAFSSSFLLFVILYFFIEQFNKVEFTIVAHSFVILLLSVIYSRINYDHFIQILDNKTRLEKQVSNKREIQEQLTKLNKTLEESVEKRTKELAETNKKLLAEIEERKKIKQELAKREKQYRLVFENAPVGILIYDKNGIVIDCNNAHLNILGASREKVIGFNMLTSLKDQKMVETIRQSLKGKHVVYEDHYITATGKNDVFVKAEFAPIYSDTGEITGAISIVENITSRKKMEIKEAQTRENLALLSETAMNFVDFNPQDDIYDYIGKKLKVFAGASIVIVNAIDENTGKLETKSVNGTSNLTRKLFAVYNSFPSTNLYENNLILNKLKTGKIAKLLGGFHELSLFQTPEIISNSLNKLFNVNEVYAVGFTRKGRIFGSAGIIMPKGKLLQNNDLIRTFIKQASISLQKKQTEDELEDSIAKYSAVMEQSADSIYLMDFDTRCVIEANRALQKLTGYSTAELSGMKAEKFIAHSIKDIESKIDILKRSGQMLVLERKYRHKTGSIVDVEVSAKIIKYKNKEVLCVVSRDITDRKKALNALHTSEENFRQLAENINDLFWIEEGNKLVYINNVYDKIWGIKREEVYKRPSLLLKNIIYEDKKQLLDALRTKEFRIDKKINLRLRVQRGKDKIFWLWVRTFPIFDENNKPYRIAGIATDITEQKRNVELQKDVEVAEETVKIKQQFLANMSHEVRTPMTGIIGMVGLLEKTSLDNEQKDFVDTIKRASSSLLNIINDILILSKIEAGKMILHPKIFNIHLTLKDINSLFYPLAQQKGVKIITRYSDNLPDYIKADENRLKQVISNLMSNAIKFTNQGSITIDISLIEEADQSYSIKVQIIDTGIGINKDVKEKLFTKFMQADASLTRDYEGIGLGLVISKEIVNLMGGSIRVESEEGKGSNFSFRFKAKKVENSQLFEHTSTKDQSKKYNFNIHVLLVEDKFVNRKVVEKMLNNAGCEVTTATNGKDALDKYVDKKFDIILMDIQMPQMDGMTAMKQLRKHFQNIPPIIALSANALKGDAERYIEEGMDDYISKPVSPPTLYKTIEKWLNNE